MSNSYASSPGLVLTRHIGETIRIGDEVAVTVVGIKGDRVRLKVSAPPKIRIDRQEIREAIEAENATLPYGRCPHCHRPGKMRERRPNGNDICENGHEYPSKDAVHDNTGAQAG